MDASITCVCSSTVKAHARTSPSRQSDRRRQAFCCGHPGVVDAHGRWLLDGKISGERLPQPGVWLHFADIFVVASETALCLFGEDGELLEKLGRGALPGVPVRALG